MSRHANHAARLDRLSPDERRHAYITGLRVRASITQCLLEMRKGSVRFWIGGPGEEVHGAATALAMHHFDAELTASGESLAPHGFGTALFPHYRSDALAALLSELRGHPDFTRDYFRQALSRVTDPMSRGRQMVMHVVDPERGLMPAQSPLGMNLGKAAGWARAQQLEGRKRVAVAISGDGTTATSDFHECWTAAGVWRLPLVVIVTDNEIAISVEPKDGRGIKSFASYAAAFDGAYLTCDGTDLDATYATTLAALRLASAESRPVLLHAHVPRLRGHSSSDGALFRYDLPDPLLRLGETLLADGLITAGEVLRRKPQPEQKDYYDDHVLGALMEAEVRRVRSVVEEVRAEPAPPPGDEYTFSMPALPEVTEPTSPDGSTAVQINEALNLALQRAVDEGHTAIWGQDVAGDKGGVFKVTRGLSQRHPEWVRNAPINEPLIVGTAFGAAHEPGLRVIPEVQFGDYTLNTLHWLVHGGHLYWASAGRVSPNVTLRTPVDPVQGGALYHSMSIDGFFTPVQGWVICCIGTSFDAYGLLRTAIDYPGPVLFLEPKILYRRAVGPILPGEPDPQVLRAARRSSGESLLGAVDLATVTDFRIPFGKAARRREGNDLTIVSWANATHQALEAAELLAAEGLEAELLDLRTLAPWDVAAVVASVRSTGRLLVAQQDRPFASFGREVQATVHEHLEDVRSKCVGMRAVPAVGQAKELEEHTVLSTERIVGAARDLCAARRGAFVHTDAAWLGAAPTRSKL